LFSLTVVGILIRSSGSSAAVAEEVDRLLLLGIDHLQRLAWLKARRRCRDE
jgi:hypothetical protein